MPKKEVFTFLDPHSGYTYELVTTRPESGTESITLKKGGVTIARCPSGAGRPPQDDQRPNLQDLRMLRFLASRAKTPIPHKEIAKKIWDKDSNWRGNISGAATRLKKCMGSEIVKVNDGRGLLSVSAKKTGDLGGIEVYSSWHDPAFSGLLERIKERKVENEGFSSPMPEGSDATLNDSGKDFDYEIRIMSIMIADTATNLCLWIEKLLELDIPVKLLLLNPHNVELMRSRYELRKPSARMSTPSQFRMQIHELQALAHRYPSDELFEIKLADHLPTGFLLHTAVGAIFSIFPAPDDYKHGPMLAIEATHDTWETLLLDWKTRWEAATVRIRNWTLDPTIVHDRMFSGDSDN